MIDSDLADLHDDAEREKYLRETLPNMVPEEKRPCELRVRVHKLILIQLLHIWILCLPVCALGND